MFEKKPRVRIYLSDLFSKNITNVSNEPWFKNIGKCYKNIMWIHELKRYNMNPSRLPDTDIKILKSVNLQNVLCGCKKWDLLWNEKTIIKINRQSLFVEFPNIPRLQWHTDFINVAHGQHWINLQRYLLVEIIVIKSSAVRITQK
jgi:hypothetical protein